MHHQAIRTTLGLSALLALAGCSTTARYVTAEHWSKGDTFYVGFTEYKETNLVVTRIGNSTAHVMLCSAGESNSVQCKPQVAVDRLLNPDEQYPEPAPPPAATPPSEPVEAAPAVSEGNGADVTNA
jgi:hypothetical protein